MRRIKILGAALMAVTAFGALMATGAMAETYADIWTLNGTVIEEPLTVAWSSRPTFDVQHLIGDPKEEGYSYRCPMSLKASIKRQETEITSITNGSGSNLISCEVIQSYGYCTTIEIEAENLPWHYALRGPTSPRQELVENGKSPAPRWKVTCKSKAYGTEIDRCAITRKMKVANYSGGVEFIYNTESPLTECSNTKFGPSFSTSGSEQVTVPGKLLKIE